jgi:hypothetical protein
LLCDPNECVTFLRDLRHGVRILAKNSTFAIAALGVMAFGIGASTAVFSVLRGVVLTLLPYREPNRLALFRVDLPGYAHQPALTSEEFFALRERSDLFESVDVIVESDGTSHRQTTWLRSTPCRSAMASSTPSAYDLRSVDPSLAAMSGTSGP